MTKTRHFRVLRSKSRQGRAKPKKIGLKFLQALLVIAPPPVARDLPRGGYGSGLWLAVVVVARLGVLGARGTRNNPHELHQSAPFLMFSLARCISSGFWGQILPFSGACRGTGRASRQTTAKTSDANISSPHLLRLFFRAFSPSVFALCFSCPDSAPMAFDALRQVSGFPGFRVSGFPGFRVWPLMPCRLCLAPFGFLSSSLSLFL